MTSTKETSMLKEITDQIPRKEPNKKTELIQIYVTPAFKKAAHALVAKNGYTSLNAVVETFLRVLIAEQKQ